MGEDVRDAWGRYAAAFAAEAGAGERESLRRLVALCDLGPGALVCDVASGAGYAGFAFARAGCRVILTDPTHEMLLAGRRGWGERGLEGEAVLVETWAENLPFAGGCLDAVVAHRAPHQFADPEAWVTECRRVLKPDGVLGLADQSPPDGWEDWHNELERWRDPTHERARSPGEWRRLVEGAGFAVRAGEIVYQTHDVQHWMDRVGCPPERRQQALRMLRDIPAPIRDDYRPHTVDGRLYMRTPQCVLVAVADRRARP